MTKAETTWVVHCSLVVGNSEIFFGKQNNNNTVFENVHVKTVPHTKSDKQILQVFVHITVEVTATANQF